MHPCISWLVVLAVSTAGVTANAQAATHYRLSGTVTGLDGAAVADAEVTIVLPKGERAIRSDTAGKFVATDLPVAMVTVKVRHLGYNPKSVDVTIKGGDNSSSIIVELEPNPAELNAVSVQAKGDVPDESLREFYARKSTNSFGRYFDAADIGKRRPQFVSEMLRQVPGVTISASTRLGNTVRIRGCEPLVWVDGVRIPKTQVDEVATPTDVAAIEVYSSFAGIPAQFFDRTATCGTILVWSKTR